MTELSSSKVETLFRKTLEVLETSTFAPPLETEKELAYTQRVVLPFISQWIATLNENGLHVRGDGGLNPLRLVWDEISLFPDVTVMNFQERLISFEVKFLRNEDPGGSLTKGIGQTFMYEKAGFKASVGIIIDCRKIIRSHNALKYSERMQLSERAVAYVFKPLIVV